MKLKVGIVDDQVLFRKGLKALLEEQGEFEVLLECNNGRELLDELEFGLNPNIVLLDLEMPVMNGVDTMIALRIQYPALPVIVLSVHFEPSYIVKMIELGASGYLQKNENPERVFTVIKNIYSNGFYLDREYAEAMRKGSMMHSQINENLKLHGITKREKEILSYICTEFTNAQMAAKLFISERTVEGHRNNLLDKTGSKNTAGLVVFALKNRLVSFELL